MPVASITDRLSGLRKQAVTVLLDYVLIDECNCVPNASPCCHCQGKALIGAIHGLEGELEATKNDRPKD